VNRDKLGPGVTHCEKNVLVSELPGEETRDSLSGNYDLELDADSPLKLRMHVRELNDKFAECMARSGQAKIFQTATGGLDQDIGPVRWRQRQYYGLDPSPLSDLPRRRATWNSQPESAGKYVPPIIRPVEMNRYRLH